MCILVYLGALALSTWQLMDAEAAMLAAIVAMLLGSLSALACVITQMVAYVRRRRAR